MLKCPYCGSNKFTNGKCDKCKAEVIEAVNEPKNPIKKQIKKTKEK